MFRTSLINESFSWLVHMKANMLFPMKNSFRKVKEKTSWVVFEENKYRVYALDANIYIYISNCYLWGPEAQGQDAIFEFKSTYILFSSD